MATACTHCGKELPRDDARFCSNCGTLVPSHPFSAQSLAASKTSSPSSQPQQEREKPVLREQVAEQPREKQVLREQVAHQLQPRPTHRIAQDGPTAPPVVWPAPMTHVSVKELSPQKQDVKPTQKDTPTSSPVQPQRDTPERELHIKVREQEGFSSSPVPEKELPMQQDVVEELPTSPMATLEQENTRIVYPSESVQDGVSEDVEHLDTLHLPNQADARSATLSPESYSRQANYEVQQSQEQEYKGYGAYTPTSSTEQRPVAIPRLPPYQPSPHQPAIQSWQASSASSIQDRRASYASATMRSRLHRKSRTPFVLLLAFLCMLVLGGGLWIVLAQPFTVPEVTKPLQEFKDTGLGVSLAYPNSWTVLHNGSTVLFSDSSQTAQVDLSVTNSSSDIAQYLKLQTTKTGMTGAQSLAPLSFAGTSWQQVQGTLQRNGVNYTEALLATTHSNHLFLLTQIAPQSTYSDEESVVFAKLRSSLQFL